MYYSIYLTIKDSLKFQIYMIYKISTKITIVLFPVIINFIQIIVIMSRHSYNYIMYKLNVIKHIVVIVPT